MKQKANNEIVYIDLFSGVGGFSKGFQDAGVPIKHHYFSEIDKHAIAVYKYQFKNAKYVGSVTDVSGTELREKHPKARFIVTFGFPCQDLSIAGKGKGFDGSRSVLFFEAIRIVKEVGAEVFIFENVKGLLSHNDYKTFETVLRTIADIGLYECEWQLVNTAWVLPQNRERIYFIGHLGGKSKPRVFPFRKGDKDFNETRQQSGDGLFVNCIDSNYHKGADGKRTMIKQVKALTETRTEEAKKIRRESMKNGEDWSPRRGKELTERKDNNSNTITATQTVEHLVVVSGVSMKRTEKGKELRKDYEAGKIKHGYNEHREVTSRKDGLANTLDTNEKSQKIMIKSGVKKGYEVAIEGDSINLSFPNSNTRKGRVGKGVAQTIDSGQQNVFKNARIRRLTETECEKLQGFPDNWTKYGDYDGEIKEVSKTQRYKQMGNAVTTDWPRLIAERLYKQQINKQ